MRDKLESFVCIRVNLKDVDNFGDPLSLTSTWIEINHLDVGQFDARYNAPVDSFSRKMEVKAPARRNGHEIDIKFLFEESQLILQTY